MVDFNTGLKAFGMTLQDIERMEAYYPRILESIVPLSLTGVPPRNFFAWKENGLVELSAVSDSEGRKNVRLNLIEYIWVKTIQVMRDFGLSYAVIKEVKAMLFTKFYQIYETHLEEIEKMYRENLDADQALVEEILVEVREQIEREKITDILMEGPLIEQSLLYTIVCGSILANVRYTLLIVKVEESFIIDFKLHDSIPYVPNYVSPYHMKPHLSIPVFTLMEDFFGTPKSEKVAEVFGFIDAKEKKVLEAIRKKDFLELHIKLDSKNELIIDAIKDGNVTDDQATKIRKILGLSSYEEVTLKYRNEKNLYFKNKKRL